MFDVKSKKAKKTNSSARFLEESTARQSAFGFIWPLIEEFYFEFSTLFFWFDLLLEARAEILDKISLVFWESWRQQKDFLKLNDL